MLGYTCRQAAREIVAKQSKNFARVGRITQLMQRIYSSSYF